MWMEGSLYYPEQDIALDLHQLQLIHFPNFSPWCDILYLVFLAQGFQLLEQYIFVTVQFYPK